MLLLQVLVLLAIPLPLLSLPLTRHTAAFVDRLVPRAIREAGTCGCCLASCGCCCARGRDRSGSGMASRTRTWSRSMSITRSGGCSCGPGCCRAGRRCSACRGCSCSGCCRDKYRELLHQMAVVGKIFPSSRWREIEGLLLKDDAFKMVEGQNRDSPRELFETFVDKWDLMYRRERSFLCRLLHSPGKLEVVISAGTTYDSFKNSITNQASYSSEIQNETFRIINKDDPVSSACLLHNELTARSVDNTRSVDNKTYKGSRRGSTRDDSSEDEGEIVEDRELKNDDVGELQ